MARPTRALLLPLLLAALAPLRAAALQAGDVLVVDRANDRILQVDATTGSVAPFSPGSATNLLSAPKAIAVGADGEVVVLNGAAPQLVAIDATSGAQSDLEGSSGPLDLGTDTAGLDFATGTPAPGTLRSVFVSALAELTEVSRTESTVTSLPVGEYPPPYETQVGRAVSAGPDGPLDVFVLTDSSLLRYDEALTQLALFFPSPVGTLVGVDAAGAVFLSWRVAACPSAQNGVYVQNASATPVEFTVFAVGGDLACPGAIAANPASLGSFALYAIADGASDSIVKVTNESAPQVAILATPEGTATPELVDLAVYAPEPGAAPLGASACGGLAALAGLGRGARRTRGRFATG